MKKTAFILVICMLLQLFAVGTFAEELQQGQQIGNVFSAADSEGNKYLVDAENNILAGTYPEISDYSGSPYAFHADGSRTLFDANGRLLVTVGPNDEVYPPHLGLYAVSLNETDTTKVTEFIVYDVESNAELFRTDRFFFYYLEQQTDKMFIEKDGKWAIIDRNGNFLTDYVYDGMTKRFNPQYVPFPDAYAIVVQNGEEKYIDWNLNEIDFSDTAKEPFITECYPMRGADGFDSYKQYYVVESKDKKGIYDLETGTYVIPLQEELSFGQTDGKTIVAGKDGMHGLVDYDLNVILPFEYGSLGYDGDFMYFSKGEGEEYISGKLDIERMEIVTDKSYNMVCPGVMIAFYSDYSSGYRVYCAEIINMAGHNLTGEIYRTASYENGQFLVSRDKLDNPTTPIDVDLNFAVIKMNGAYLPYDGVIREDRTLVPMREIVENLGGAVSWNEESRTATAEINGKTVALTIDSKDMLVDGAVTTLDVPAQLINDKTMLPLRALAEAVGFTVDWDERIRCVYIQ